MLSKLTKWLYRPEPKKESNSLVMELSEIVYDSALEEVLYGPVSSIYEIRVYHRTLGETIGSISKTNSTYTYSIKLRDYIDIDHDELPSRLLRVMKVLDSVKVNRRVVSDLEELVRSYRELKEILNA